MKFENQAAIDNNIKIIKSTFTRYNNWKAKYDALNTKRLELDTLTKEERNDFYRAWAKSTTTNQSTQIVAAKPTGAL